MNKSDDDYKTVILSIDYKCKYGKLIDYLIENEDVGLVNKIKSLKTRSKS